MTLGAEASCSVLTAERCVGEAEADGQPDESIEIGKPLDLKRVDERHDRLGWQKQQEHIPD
jgi:hypothetical protein